MTNRQFFELVAVRQPQSTVSWGKIKSALTLRDSQLRPFKGADVITKWRLSNFKSIRSQEIEMLPLTVLSGLNSSGKSSVLQSIRLVTQTLRNQSASRALVLNGYDIQLGDFESIRCTRSVEKHIEIGFDIELAERPPSEEWRPPLGVNSKQPTQGTLEFSCSVRFVASPDRTRASSSTSPVRFDRGSYSVSSLVPLQTVVGFEDFDEAESPNPLRQARLEIRQSNREELLEILEVAPDDFRWPVFDENLPPFISEFDPSPATSARSSIHLAMMSHFLPAFFFRSYLVEQRRLQEAFRAIRLMLLLSPDDSYFGDEYGDISPATLSETKTPDGLLRTINEVLTAQGLAPIRGGATIRDLISRLHEVHFSKSFEENQHNLANDLSIAIVRALLPDLDPSRTSVAFEPVLRDSELQAFVWSASTTVDYFVRNIRYLGPIRLEPHAAQSFAPSSEADDVGPKGEYAAVVFDANRYRPVAWWNPDTFKSVETSLAEAVNFWLTYLGVAELVTVDEAGASGVAWRVRSPHDQLLRSLSSVGVGVSQVLPILVAGLLAPENALLLIEQPELHLHPRAQARLAEFFVGLAKVGTRCIVETHSEAFISQIRLSLAHQLRGEGNLVRIYFARQDETGDTFFDPVHINKYGMVSNWPTGFFDESLILEDKLAENAIRRRASDR